MPADNKPLPLVFDAPRRAMPPRHLADMSLEQSRDVVTELGLPAFRAKQIANQYYGRLVGDPATMTDLPAGARGGVAEALFPRLLEPLRQIACDAGDTRKTLWRLHDGSTVESVLMVIRTATRCASPLRRGAVWPVRSAPPARAD